jgi:GR25 family glycosyltransferase involved in LPS biosynthesis
MGIVRYINLASAWSRRQAMEGNLGQVPRGRWHAKRFDAIGSTNEQVQRLQGRCSDKEKATFLSHRLALVQTAQHHPGQHVHILEDDALLGQRTYEILDRFLESEEAQKWDVVFTDIIVTRLQGMLDLLAQRRELMAHQAVKTIDLAFLEFAALTSYVVNAATADRVLFLMNSVTQLDEPVDLLVRRWIWTGQLRACVLFPFVTAVSSQADHSQIQPTHTDPTAKIWNAYRNLVWLERDLAISASDCQSVAARVQDLESNLMGILCASMVSPHFRLM